MDKAGRGVWTLDSKMIDMPIVVAARAMISKAKLYGIDIWNVLDGGPTGM